MSITSVATLKTWFETGKRPTQEEFESLIDSFHHKSGDIEIPAGKKIKIGDDFVLQGQLEGVDNLEADTFFENLVNTDYKYDKPELINLITILVNRCNHLNGILRTHGLTA